MSAGFDQTWPSRQLFITARLRERRADLGLTQQQVVIRLARHGLRMTNRSWSSLEHGAGLEVAKLPALARALDCTVTYLVGLTDDPHRWDPDQPATARPARAQTAATSDDAPIARSLILGANVPDRGPNRSLDTQPTTP